MITALFSLPFSGRVDVVWAMSPNYLSVFPAATFRVFRRSKLVHDVVDIWPTAIEKAGYSLTPWARWAIDRLTRLSYALSDTIVTLSPSLASSLERKTPGSVPITVIDNCVKDGFFQVPNSSASQGPKCVMYLGTLSPSNDFSAILHAAEKFAGNEVTFRIIGTGEEAQKIGRFLSGGSTDNVRFEPSVVKHEMVPQRLSEADILVLSLRAGFGDVSFPSKLVEYFAAGRPVICLADGALAEHVRSNGLAVVSQPGDVDGLVSSILRLLNDPDYSQALATRAREYARREHSFASFTTKVGMIRPVQATQGTELREANS